jgi:SulP family sulfate permease
MIEVEAHRLAAAGGGLYLAALKPTVREMLERSGALAALGAGHVFERKGDAIAAILARRNTATCAACTVCVFDECPLAAPAAPAQDAR